MFADPLAQSLKICEQLRVELARAQGSVAVAADHRDGPAGEVAELVGELALVALLEGGAGDGAVLAEGHLAQDVEAQRVGAVAIDCGERVEHVAKRLAHLLAFHQQVAVDEQVLGKLESNDT